MRTVLALVLLLIAPLPALGQSLPACARSGGDCDCRDLTRAQARALLARDRSDPHRLDRDGDGRACEITRRGRTSSRSYAPRAYAPARTLAPVRARRAAPARSYASSGYYTGPRGGCYTYSASGRKRYVDRSYCQ